MHKRSCWLWLPLEKLGWMHFQETDSPTLLVDRQAVAPTTREASFTESGHSVNKPNSLYLLSIQLKKNVMTYT
jgi:hypothetical protein